jgi:transcriptional repressor NF-X1
VLLVSRINKRKIQISLTAYLVFSVYTCGQHRCEKPCHPCTANFQACPSDPSVTTTCPCGKHAVTELLDGKNRELCTDPVPTCEITCNKVAVCGHACVEKCHLGDCPPCQVTVQVPCRCHSTHFEDTCANVCEASGGEPPLCDRVCKSVRNCSKHACGVKCCSAMKVKGKRKAGTEYAHDCPETCDQLLSCGIHKCQAMCHKGKCLPCLEAEFDDVTCHCTRTRLEPPVRCGTKLPPCPHTCIRPNPCGHIRFLNHNCHPDDEPCPPCPALVSRYCLCGKTELKNVPCYRESPRCGRVCEKDLSCGKHNCLKTCHGGPCIAEDESCTQTCGSPRSCGHPCQEKCHGNDSVCPEIEPCIARVKASCKCGQNTMEIPCNATGESNGSKKDLECNDFCAKVLRNRRLAMAFDIKRDDIITPSASPSLSNTSGVLSSDDLGYYDDGIREFFLENASWCRHMETLLIEFVQDSEKKSYHCKPMRSEYRRFIHRYAVHFNIATEAIDKEPYRSVVIRKTLGITRIPPILLSRAARNPALNRAPTTTQGIEADTSGRSASRQPVNALYLSDMAFGLTKLELDADLVPIIKIGDDTIHFTSKWVNENDAIVIPLISDAVSMDEKETIIWQLKKYVKSVFITVNESKAARIDCCWVNQKGEVTWNEKQLSEDKINAAQEAAAAPSRRKLFVNSYEALNTVDDDGWMRVGGDNPYKPAKDAWIEAPKAPTPIIATTSATTTEASAQEDEGDLHKYDATVSSDTTSTDEEIVQVDEKDTVNETNSNATPESDDWEILLEEEDEN